MILPDACRTERYAADWPSMCAYTLTCGPIVSEPWTAADVVVDGNISASDPDNPLKLFFLQTARTITNMNRPGSKSRQDAGIDMSATEFIETNFYGCGLTLVQKLSVWNHRQHVLDVEFAFGRFTGFSTDGGEAAFFATARSTGGAWLNSIYAAWARDLMRAIGPAICSYEAGINYRKRLVVARHFPGYFNNYGLGYDAGTISDARASLDRIGIKWRQAPKERQDPASMPSA